MTRARRNRAIPSVPAVVGRLRADRWPLLLATAVLAVTSALAVATPRLIQRTADDAIRHAVTTADDVEVTAVRPLVSDPARPRVHDAYLAAATADLAELIDRDLPPTLGEVLAEPVTTIATSPLMALGLEQGWQGEVALPSVRMYHLWRDGAPAVEWVTGGPPGGTLTREELRALADLDAWSLEAAIYQGLWPVEVALAQDVARALELDVGDHWTLTNQNHSLNVDLVLSGTFRPVDPADPVWANAPDVLEPRVVGSSLTRVTQVAGLLSDDSLSTAAFLMPLGTTSRIVSFAPDARALDTGNADTVAAEIASMKAADGVARFGREAERTETRLDAVLRETQDEIGAATAQAAVLLAGILAVAVLTLLLAGRLLAHRRTAVLVLYRARGATLRGIFIELGLEAVLVAGVGCGGGILLANAVVPGAVPWAWLVPITVLAVLGAPALGTHAAARGTPRRAAANRHERHTIERDRMAGRVALEVAAVLVAVGAITALRTRGGSTTQGVDPLLALAPTVAAFAGGMLALHALPVLLRRVLRRAARSRAAIPVLSVARAHATTHALPFLTLAVAVGLSGLGAAVAATVQRGEVDASWAAVGADVTAVTDPDPELAALASRLVSNGGVQDAVVGRVDDHAQVFGPWGSRLIRVVALPAVAYQGMLAETPLPDAKALGGLSWADGAPLPVLVSPDLEGETSLSLLWEDMRVEITPIGSAPGLLAVVEGIPESTVVLDMAGLEAATRSPVHPDRLWLIGPGAEVAAAGTPELAGAALSTRDAWLDEHRASPLTTALIDLIRAGNVLLLLLTVLAVVLGATTGAAERARTLAALRTLGIGVGGARSIGIGELLPGVVLACLSGAALGAGLALAVTGPLDLRLVTGQLVDPRTVIPWEAGVPVAAAVVTVVLLVLVESFVRRGERVGETLRNA
jgi:putative ABC transport system permease protein